MQSFGKRNGSRLQSRVSNRARLLNAADLVTQTQPPRTDLIAAVLTVVDQMLVDQVDFTKYGGHHGQPLVMHPRLGKRPGLPNERRTHDDCRTSDHIAAQQQVERSAAVNASTIPSPELNRVKKRSAERCADGVNQCGVTVH